MSNSPSTTDIAWAAGLFEGEGTMATNKYEVKSAASGYRLRFEMNVVMADEDVVSKFGRVAGIGSVWQKGQSEKMAQLGRKKLWQWKASGPKAVEFMLLLLPHLGHRRSMQFLTILARIEEARSDAV